MNKLIIYERNTKRRFNDFFIFFLVLFSLNFFSATFAQSGFFKNISFVYLFVAIMMSLPFLLRKNDGFVFPVKIISISIFFSIFMAYFSWGQNISYSLSTIPYLTWLVFFYLLHIKYPIKKLESIILIYGLIYVALYFFQFFHSDVVYFGFKEEFIEDRGVIRIDFPGGGVFFLSYFILLVKSFQKKRFQWLYVLFVIIGIIVTILQVTRQSIAVILIITIFHFFKESSLTKKIGIATLFSATLFYFFTSNNSISHGLITQQEETVSEGTKYIRILAGDFFLNDFSPNVASRIFGNGLPNNTSDYGKYILWLQDNYGFYLADVGLIGFYAMFGLFPIIGLLIIFFKCFTIKLPKEHYYLKYYTFFLLITSFTSDYLYSTSYLFANAISIYCFQFLYEQQE